MKDLKNKIKHFSKGDFQLGKPNVIFPETKVIFKLGEGEQYKGSFTLQNQVDGNIRGLVYPSSFRVKCEEQGFEGNPITINFTYDGRGLPPGHVEHGKFTIVCNGGEYEIRFAAIIERPYVMTEHGKIQSIEDFKRLAFKDYGEAVRLFRSRSFYEVLKYEEPRIQHLYDYMRTWSLDERGLEEFLVGIKQKEKIFLTLNCDGSEFSELLENTRDTIIITKNTWGYLDIKVILRGEFLKIDRNVFTTDDFFGNTLELEYEIMEHQLHKGCNYGQIIIETPYESIPYEIEVTKNAAIHENYRLQDIKYAQLIKSFLHLESEKLDIDTWLKKAEVSLDELQQQTPNDDKLKLIQAHVYLIAHKEEEAKWVLENYNYNKFAIGKNVEINCYYLFLTAMLRRELGYSKKVIEELQRAYLKNAHSWKLLCMLVELDPHYKDSYERLHVLERQFYNGANQIIFYLVAFRCYKKKSSNLKKLGTFEVQVLIFATKYKLMTKDLALYTANLASQQKAFDPHIYKILVETYKMFEEPMILTAICTLLIKGNQVNHKYFAWYEKAVNSEIKIAQLYEYYMASIDVNKVRSALPRMVHLYFLHGNSLDYQRCALLYANLIAYEDETSDLYEDYREEMKSFAWEQLEKRHINEQLRIIYKRFLSEQDMNAERLKALYDICYAYEITTNVPNMKYVMVIEADGAITQKVPYTEYGAQIFLNQKEDRIVWEAIDGRHYIDSIPYETRRLFYELRYIDMCKKHMDILRPTKEEETRVALTFDTLNEYGIDYFEEHEVFCLCSKKIRDENYNENDFLTYVCYQLFRREQYDKVILTYLANYFCGATRDMKTLWYIARDYEVYTFKLSERILTQMLFAEMLFGEVEIFEDYYSGDANSGLVKAYLAFVCREYVVRERQLDSKIVNVLEQEYIKGEELLDVMKIALLKYYVNKERDEHVSAMLKKCMQSFCEKQIYLPMFMQYDEEWLREFQIWDKTMIDYVAKENGKVKISYQLLKENEETVEFVTESIAPMYENIYVKSFVLFEGEVLKYTFKEIKGDELVHTEKREFRLSSRKHNTGKYGRLNDISTETQDKRGRILEYALEMELANDIFVLYE
ncbi:DUF5717 family protein [Lachnospiraceae bacterium LCP25S3_G4]